MNSDFHFQQLAQQLHVWNGRRRLRDGLIWVPRTLLAGLLLAILIAAAARLRPFLTNNEVGLLSATLAAMGLLIGIIWLIQRRFSLLQQARFADAQFSLYERTTTAVEIHHGTIVAPSILAQQQLDDTLTAVSHIDAKTALPLHLQRQDWIVILIGIALLVTAVFLPNEQEALLLKQRALDDSIKEQIESLEALKEEIIQNPALTNEQQEELTAPLDSAIEQLQTGGTSREEAVATLSETEAELRELAAQNDTSQLQQQLQQAGQPLAENEVTQSLGESLQNGNLSQAGSELAQLADTLPSLSDAQLSRLAQDLAQTAASLEGVDDQLAQQLAEAAEALQNGDVAAAQQALREAAATMQQRAQEAAAAQQAQQAAGQLSEGRQEVAQAGQPGQGQQPGQQPGQGEGEGQQPGQGEGQGQGTGSGAEDGGGTGGPGPGGGHTENVYVPELVDLSSTEGIDVELPAECVANPADCGALLSETPTEFGNESSIVPYSQVFGDYRDAANEALAEDYVPLGMKGFIRDYFTSLEP